MITAHVAGEMKYRPPSAETENAVNLYFEDCFKNIHQNLRNINGPTQLQKKKIYSQKMLLQLGQHHVLCRKEPWIQKDLKLMKDLEEKDKIASYEWFCEGARQVYPMNDAKATLPLRLINKMWDSIPEEQSRSKKNIFGISSIRCIREMNPKLFERSC